MDVSILAINVVSGLMWGCVLGVAAIGLTLLWGVMKVVNLAHGELLLLGGYAIAWLYVTYGLNPLVGALAALAIGVAAGAAIYWALLHKLVGKVDIITLRIEMSTLLMMFALSIALYNVYSHVTRSEPRGIGLWHVGPTSVVKFGPVAVQMNHLFAAVLALFITIAVHLFLTRTMVGKAIRAVMQDSQAAALVGIDPVKIKMFTAMLAIGVTALSGFLVLLYESSIIPGTAYKYAPLGFVIVVLGGLGSILGSFIGGVIIGVVYGLSKVIVAELYSPMASDPIALSTAFVILVLVLLFKPEGLFGRR